MRMWMKTRMPESRHTDSKEIEFQVRVPVFKLELETGTLNWENSSSKTGNGT